MKRRFLSVLAAGILCLVPHALGEGKKLVVAVFNMEAEGIQMPKETLDRLSDYLTTRLAETGRYQIVPRDELMKRLLQQKKESYRLCYDRSCQIELGRELAAEKSLDTKVIKLGSRCTVTSMLYDLKRATTDSGATVHGECTEDGIVASLDGAVVKLSGGGGDITVTVDWTTQDKPGKPAHPPGMLFIGAGNFWMGCNSKVDSECDPDEEPGRWVHLDEYYIDLTETTVLEYMECVQGGACSDKGLNAPFWDGKKHPEWEWSCNWDKPGREDHPINCLDWSQAKTFCEWAGKRLPTEAEWEKAARGTDGRKYPWGSRGYASWGKEGKAVANIADEAARRKYPGRVAAKGYDDRNVGTAVVGSYLEGKSPCGAYDMIGNVWEWVADWYVEGYYKKAPGKNPKGPSSGKLRVTRGGSWVNVPKNARASYRYGYDPKLRRGLIGVRCAYGPAK